MKILVLMKQVPDTFGERKLDASGRLDRDAADLILDEITERALEVALLQKDVDKNTEVIAVTMGPDSAKESLRKALAMGADSAIHIVDDSLAGSDIQATGSVLASVLSDQITADTLVLAGNESTDGRGGVVPSFIAAKLNLPFVSGAREVKILSGQVQASQTGDSLERRLQANLPALVAVTEQVAEPRFPTFRGNFAAKRKPITVVNAANIVAAGKNTTKVIASAEVAARSGGQLIYAEDSGVTKLVEFLKANDLV